MAYDHSHVWRYHYNANKSLAMGFGRDVAPNQKIILGSEEIKMTSGTSHMGVPLAPKKDKMKQVITQRKEAVEKEVNVMMTLGNYRNPLPPLIGKKIYDSMCIPKLMYGLEACTLSAECLLMLEISHRYCARKIQGLPPQTPIVVPLATLQLGLLTVESMLHCRLMLMLYRWLSLPYACIYKKIVIARLVSHLADNGPHLGPLYDVQTVRARPLCTNCVRVW